jgi:tetratricopeptide (TPR) repeat protein
MKIENLAAAIIINLALVCTVYTQEANTGKPSPASQQDKPHKEATQSPKLDQAERMNTRVVELYAQGRYDEAIPLAKRVLETREKLLPPESDEVLGALSNLAELYLASGKYTEAIPRYQRLLAAYEKKLGPDDPKLAPDIDKLAFLSFLTSDFGKAEALNKRALAIREKALGPEHLEVAKSLFNLAEYYRAIGEYQKAEPFYQRALAIRDKALPPDDPLISKTVERYRCLYYESEQTEKLKEFSRRRSMLHALTSDIGPVGDIVNGKAVSIPKPRYPIEAVDIRIGGTAVIQVTIDEAGKVVEASDVCGAFTPFAREATKAAYNALFTPTLVSGSPVKVKGVIVYRFIMPHQY